MFSRNDVIEETDSSFVGKRNKRSREDLLPAEDEFNLSYSSIMFSRSSSVVTEINESRSSEGSWYLRVNDVDAMGVGVDEDDDRSRVLERRLVRSSRVV